MVSETAALVQRRLEPQALTTFFERVAPGMETLYVDEQTHRAAVAALLARTPTRVSLVDFVSFEMMRSEGLDRAFAFDDDFEKAGFATLP